MIQGYEAFGLPFTKVIDGYTVFIASLEKFNEWKANIVLKNGSLAVVDLRFVADPANWVTKQRVVQNGVSTIYENIDHFTKYLDILRNEKPLCVHLYERDASSLAARCLFGTYSASEPVGENE